jgi:hypothetical protein
MSDDDEDLARAAECGAGGSADAAAAAATVTGSRAELGALLIGCDDDDDDTMLDGGGCGEAGTRGVDGTVSSPPAPRPAPEEAATRWALRGGRASGSGGARNPAIA